jgi:hypothetical protein
VNRLAIVLLLAVVSVGCGKGDPYVPVTGTVKYSDGSALKGFERMVTFQPMPSGPGTKGASSLIADDSTFSLRTLRPGDGALPGNYVVTVHAVDAVRDGKSLVAEVFTNAQSTPLKATVTADAENHFDLTVERP